MKKLLYLTVIALTVSLTYSNLSFAVCGEGPPDTFTCNTNPPNPDPTGIQQGGNNNNLTVNVLPGAEIDTDNGNGGDGIETGRWE